MNNQIFYEFVPFTSEYFTHDGVLIDKFTALTVDEVKPNIDYAIVITTNAGLWRYLIGDLVQFTDVEGRLMKITGRIKQYLSLVGEHLSLDNINQALDNVCKEMKVEVNEYCIYIDVLNQRHAWTIGADSYVDTDLFVQRLDLELGKLNDDYRSVRKASLNTPSLIAFKNNLFYKFMESMGKLGSQNKFPRVMNEYQASEWKRFLADNS